jgi:NADPH:quinone reductase-like Zn-dependent oxidoreductase
MLIQICKLCGYSPIVAVVGSSHKVEICKQLGADVVIDKSECVRRGKTIWDEAKRAVPVGYISIFDATGVETLQESYDHLSQCGR